MRIGSGGQKVGAGAQVKKVASEIGTDISKLWVTVKSLTNPRKGVTFNDETVADPKMCAVILIEHPGSDVAKRRVLRHIRPLLAKFTMGDVSNAIRNVKSSKALYQYRKFQSHKLFRFLITHC